MKKSLAVVKPLIGKLDLRSIFSAFWPKIVTTWAIVAIENILIALIPFLIGLTIDGLLSHRFDELFLMILVLVLLSIVAVGRRIFDTRAYGSIRVHLGSALEKSNSDLDVSTRNTRLDISRELVDFLEIEFPEILTAVIQIAVSLVVLTLYSIWLGATSIAVVLGMLIVYAIFHDKFYRLNAELNARREKQVRILDLRNHLGLFRHLRALRKTEISISDTEAVVYGGIFLLQIAYIAYNLVLAVDLPGLTPGRIFAIATYSWEYVEAALALPMALQSWSRLSEITDRINRGSDSSLEI